jgi:hypothetical protein
MLNDITNGTNPGCDTVGFSAVPGQVFPSCHSFRTGLIRHRWDPVTGLGTLNFPKMLNIIWACHNSEFVAIHRKGCRSLCNKDTHLAQSRPDSFKSHCNYFEWNGKWGSKSDNIILRILWAIYFAASSAVTLQSRSSSNPIYRWRGPSPSKPNSDSLPCLYSSENARVKSALRSFCQIISNIPTFSQHHLMLYNVFQSHRNINSSNRVVFLSCSCPIKLLQ